MNLSLGISPCPNDTFIFDAMLHGGIDCGSHTFELMMEDVEALNQQVLQSGPDICKVSYALLPLIADRYRLLDAGSALGKGVGPLLITYIHEANTLHPDTPVAIPGEHTTAHFLFSYAFPLHTKKVFMRYDDIEGFVSEKKGAGVIIHENRFTYSERGLFLLKDLGAYWEDKTAHPIPLGGIVIKKEISEDVQTQLSLCIRKSIEKAWLVYPQLSPFITCNASEMSEAIMRKHIELYVNDYSLSLGAEGRSAVMAFVNVFDVMHSCNTVPEAYLPL